MDLKEVVIMSNRAFAQQKWQDVLRFQTRVIDLDPTRARSFQRRAAAYLRLGRYQEAEKDLQKAAELIGPFRSNFNQYEFNDYVKIKMTMAQVSHRIGTPNDLINATQALTDILSLLPDNADALRLRSLVHSARKMHQEAVQDARQCVKLNPDDFDRLTLLGSAIIESGDHSNIEEACTPLAKLSFRGRMEAKQLRLKAQKGADKQNSEAKPNAFATVPPVVASAVDLSVKAPPPAAQPVKSSAVAPAVSPVDPKVSSPAAASQLPVTVVAKTDTAIAQADVPHEPAPVPPAEAVHKKEEEAGPAKKPPAEAKNSVSGYVGAGPQKVAELFASAGPAYSEYRKMVLDNGVSGLVLAYYAETGKLDDLFRDLGISVGLHKIVLSRHIKAALCIA
jgi:tetratricopeptide (TPR) repeat protein